MDVWKRFVRKTGRKRVRGKEEREEEGERQNDFNPASDGKIKTRK